MASRIVVCDNGTGFVKAGYAGDNFPRAVFPSMVGTPMLRAEMESIPKDVELKDIMVGDEANKVRYALNITYPVDNGIVKEWTKMQALWDYTFYEKLQIEPQEHSVVLTQPPYNPLAGQKKTVQIMFERYGFQKMSMQLQALLVLAAQGVETGCVLDSGDGVTHAIPVWQGFVLTHLIKRLNVAGRHLTKYLMKLLLLRGYAFNQTADFEVVRRIKEKHCYIAQDKALEERLALETVSIMRSHQLLEGKKKQKRTKDGSRLPDGTVVRLGQERFRTPEALFDPSLVEEEAPGIHELLFGMIQSAELDIRLKLYENIVLSGGSTMFPGLPTRLGDELRKLYLTKVLKGDESRMDVFRLNIHDPPLRKNLVFQGAAFLAETFATDDRFWVTRKQYEENGPDRAIERFNLGANN